MKKVIAAITTLVWYAVIISPGFAQDTTPRGPAQWTAGNWLGFCIQIGLFFLAIFLIYKLALGGECDKLESEAEGLNSTSQDTADNNT